MNKKILKDTLVLTVITLVSGLLLGLVYEVTKNPIKEQKAKVKQEACENVFTDADSFDTKNPVDISSAEELLKKDYSACTIDECITALNAEKAKIGYVLTVTTTEGYAGDITFMMGIKLDGTLNGIDILTISETAGLGMKAKEPSFKNQFSNKKADEFILEKNASSQENSIQAISSATITSKAITKAVNAGLLYCREALEKGAISNE